MKYYGHLAVEDGSTGNHAADKSPLISVNRDCVERMAETAGCHYFKCPLCNNKKEFSQEMQDFGGRKV